MMMPVLPIAHIGRSVAATYEGTCPVCDAGHSANLAPTCAAPFIPPPSIVVGCQCQQPPPDVRLVYRGAAHA